MLKMEFDCKKCKNADICKANDLGNFREIREIKTFFKYYPFLDMTFTCNRYVADIEIKDEWVEAANPQELYEFIKKASARSKNDILYDSFGGTK